MTFDGNIDMLQMAFWQIILASGPVLLIALSIGLFVGVLMSTPGCLVNMCRDASLAQCVLEVEMLPPRCPVNIERCLFGLMLGRVVGTVERT